MKVAFAGSFAARLAEPVRTRRSLITVALIGGSAAGPWVAGIIHDATGSYRLAFLLAITCCVVSAVAIWIAAPRKIRLVPGQVSGRDDL